MRLPGRRRTFHLPKGPALFSLPPDCTRHRYMLDNRDLAFISQRVARGGEVPAFFGMKPAFTNWNPAAYGQSIASLLALAGDGERLMPLAEGTCCSEQARARIQDSKLEDLFASARAPRAALA